MIMTDKKTDLKEISELSLFDWLQYFILKLSARRVKYLYLYCPNFFHKQDLMYSNHDLKDLGFINNIKTSIIYFQFHDVLYKDYFFNKCAISKVPTIIDISILLQVAKTLKEQNITDWIIISRSKIIELYYTVDNTQYTTIIGNEITDAVSLLQINKIINELKLIQSNENNIIEEIEFVKTYEQKELQFNNIKIPLLNGLDIVSKEIAQYNLNDKDTINLYLYIDKQKNIKHQTYTYVKYLTEFNNKYFKTWSYRPYFILFNLNSK
jgi:hypothetical protein